MVEHLDGRLELIYWREQGADEVVAINAALSDLADKSALLAATR